MDKIGQILKQQGMAQVENTNPGFVTLMRLVAICHYRTHGEVSADDLRRYASDRGIEPHHPNAWGSVFRRGFKRVGFRPSTIPSNHARLISVWAEDNPWGDFYNPPEEGETA